MTALPLTNDHAAGDGQSAREAMVGRHAEAGASAAKGPRHALLTRLPTRKCAARPHSATASLYDLLGTPRAEPGTVTLLVHAGRKRARKRLDMPCDTLVEVACGAGHLLVTAESKGARQVLGVGDNWDLQLRTSWHCKPQSSLLHFSRPVPVYLARPPPLKPVDAKSNKPQDKPQGDAEEQQEAPRPAPEPELEDPRRITAIAASRRTTCAAYETEVVWTAVSPHRLVLPRKVVQVAAGSAHVLLRCSDRRVYGFGSGAKGQLGIGARPAPPPPCPLHPPLPPTDEHAAKAAEEDALLPPPQEPQVLHPVLLMDNATCVAAAFDRSVVASGPKVWTLDGDFFYFFEEAVEQLVCGRAHQLALLSKSRRLYAWGNNERGALGLSSSVRPLGGEVGSPKLVNGQLGPLWHKVERISEVAAGEHFSALRTARGEVYTWGNIRGAEMVLRPQPLDLPGPAARVFAGPDYLVVVQEQQAA